MVDPRAASFPFGPYSVQRALMRAAHRAGCGGVILRAPQALGELSLICNILHWLSRNEPTVRLPGGLCCVIVVVLEYIFDGSASVS